MVEGTTHSFPDVTSQEKDWSNDQGSQATGSTQPAFAPGKVCKALSYYLRPANSVYIITDSECGLITK
jgi:hypothetical protein